MKTMNALLAVSFLALATTAYAGPYGPDRQAGPQPGADVEQPAPLPVPQASSKTRAQVVQELYAAQDQGMTWSQEATEPLAQHAAQPVPTRGHIQAELRQARQQGQVSFGDLDYPPAS